jgi:hypothetical protein
MELSRYTKYVLLLMRMSDDINRKIASKLSKYELLPWIDKNKLHIGGLCENPNITKEYIKLLENNKDKIYKWSLSCNPNPYTIEFIKKHNDLIDWNSLSSNTNDKALEILENNLDKINWHMISRNPCKKAYHGIIFLLIQIQKQFNL